MPEDESAHYEEFERAMAVADKLTALRRLKEKTRDDFVYTYKNRLIIYLDVLGMKDLLQGTGDDANAVGKVLNTFRKYSDIDESDKKGLDITITNFSDLIVRTAPLSSGAFFFEVLDLAYIQANLVSRGWLLRGAMTINKICVQNDLIFGNGLVEAYELESKKAKYPRIIITDTVMNELQHNSELRTEGSSYEEEMSYLKFVQKDRDGTWFVNYLDQMSTDADSTGQYIYFLEKHKTLIEKQRTEVKNMTSGELRDRRLEKLQWLIKLHTSHLRSKMNEHFRATTGRDRDEFAVVNWSEE